MEFGAIMAMVTQAINAVNTVRQAVHDNAENIKGDDQAELQAKLKELAAISDEATTSTLARLDELAGGGQPIPEPAAGGTEDGQPGT